ncbi:MAG TPA: O-antigen translocase [Methylocella sp.]|jgi:PST family polysaccharide transporter
MSGNSYSQILRASSIIGGAQAVNYLIGLARVKLVAMLLGPTGVGLVGLYTSATGLLGVVSGMGVSAGAVREIVRAYGQDNAEEAARTVIVLRRVCWATGLLGWVLAILFREQISTLMTGSPKHAGTIAWLGSTLLLSAISSGQLALLQGLRRIGDLARANVFGALVGSLVTVLIYFALGQAGIVPALIVAALLSLAGSYWFARRIEVAPVTIDWSETWRGFRRLIGLGLAFMWSAVLVAGLDMLTRSIIARQFGVEAAGIYQAAWAISGLFANFVLSAMGTDFYPRLTATIHDRSLAARAVNEQTEIGILLALPGLLAALAFAPLAIKLIYTQQFLAAADLLPWMALGVFGRVVSWPLGYVQLATGASRWFASTETIFVGAQALLTFWLVEGFGMIGAAYAFAATYAFHMAANFWVAHMLIGFSWSSEARKLVLASAVFVVAAFAARFIAFDLASFIAGGALTLAGSLFSLRGLAKRLGEGNRLVKWARMVPGGQALLSGVIPRA